MDKVTEWSIHLPSPLPDVIITGDFNMPNNDWANLSLNSSSASHQTMSLLNVTDSLFLEQHIHEPTRNGSILDLVFSSSDLVSSISLHETATSDHNIIFITKI